MTPARITSTLQAKCEGTRLANAIEAMEHMKALRQHRDSRWIGVACSGCGGWHVKARTSVNLDAIGGALGGRDE
jgi:hypothetical protein